MRVNDRENYGFGTRLPTRQDMVRRAVSVVCVGIRIAAIAALTLGGIAGIARMLWN